MLKLDTWWNFTVVEVNWKQVSDTTGLKGSENQRWMVVIATSSHGTAMKTDILSEGTLRETVPTDETQPCKEETRY